MKLEEFRAYAKVSNVIPVSRRLLADGETPLGVYRKLAKSAQNTFLLESAEHGGAWSRYSFIGVHSEATLSEKDGLAYWQGTAPAGAPTGIDPLEALRLSAAHLKSPKIAGLPPLTGGLVGFMGYDVVRRLEKLPSLSHKDIPLPELSFMLTSDLAVMDFTDLMSWVEKLDRSLTKRQKAIAHEVIKEIKLRIGFLLHVGLDYLNLDRPARTLSGGEAQRIRLATQIGSQLTGVTYILDEPSIGLHQRDNQRLIEALRELSEIGNTVLVVEHDKDIMLASDFLIDLGPGAGKHGGELVAAGIPETFLKKNTLTALYLREKMKIKVPAKRRKGSGNFLELKGANGNNLKNVNIKIPLGTFCCVTGVSGSGKSSLINETLYPILRQHFYKSIKRPMEYKTINGLEHVDKVIEIDQSPIGRTPRSNPATYTKMFDEIRKIYASLPEAKIRGYKPGRFSFNVKGGRCEECHGAGKRNIEMNFLPDVQVDCERCQGRRYNRETLEILYKGKSISDVLNMTVEEAVDFFDKIPRIHSKTKTLKDVGLGYITLGQQATTLSGGEAQRVKLSEELSKRATGNTIYILDEPTTGLHFDDIRQLLNVLNKLVEKGNSIVIIEHNLDVIKVADYVIDMGPEGGNRGGKVVAQGTPEKVAKVKESHTGHFLKMEF